MSDEAITAPAAPGHDTLPAPVSVGRDRELAALQAAFERVRRGASEIVTVVGPPGSGRTALLEAFTETVVEGAVGFGSFASSAGAARDGVGEAIRGLALSVLGQPDAVVESWTRALRSDLGDSTAELLRLVPELDGLVDGPHDPGDGSGPDGAQNRLVRSVAAVVDVTARHVGPVTLVLDNLHHASGADLDLLGVIALAAPTVLVVAGSRVSGAGVLDRWVDTPGVEVRRLELRPLDRREVRRWLEEAHGLVASDEVLALIELRTQGNPLLIEQLVLAADEAGARRDIPAAAGSELDADWLRAQPVGDAGSLADRFAALPSEQVRVLAAAACLDRAFDVATVAAALAVDASDVASAVWTGIEAGLVVGDVGATDLRLGLDRRYRFSHDRLAEALQSQLSEGERAELHLRLGRYLRDNGRADAAVAELARGADAMTDTTERAAAARLAAEQAVAARRAASFREAHQCFLDGLVLADGAVDDPVLMSQLRFGLAECSRLIGDERVEEFLDAATAHAADGVERGRLAVLRMKVWLSRHREREALEVGIAALAELGISIPPSASRSRAGVAIARTAASLRKRSIESLAGLPPATDRSALVAGEILTEMFSTTYTVAQDLFPLVVVRAVDLTLEAGRLPVSPVAFAGYGQLLVHLGRYDAALRYGELALRLADEPDCVENRPWTAFMFHGFIAPWRRPVRDGVAPVRSAYGEAMRLGDHEYAGYLAATELQLLSNAGAPLDVIEARATELAASLTNQPKQQEICEGVRQFVHNLMGRNPDPTVLGGTTGYDERVVVPRAEQGNDLVALAVHGSLRLGLDFWSGDYAGAIAAAEKMEQFVDGVQGTGGMSASLIPSVIARLRHEPHAPSTRRAARKVDRLMTKWAKGCPANYEAVTLLVKGERAIAEGNFERAERYCEAAIRSADRNESPLIAVQAREAAAVVYSRTDRATAARGYVLEAARLWSDLGYRIRLDWLCTQYPWLSDELDLPSADAPAEVTADAGDDDAGDLVRSLLRDVFEISRSERVLLVIRRHESLHLAAAGTAGDAPDRPVIDVLDPPSPIVDGGPYSTSMLRLAARQREPVTSSRAMADWSDAYLTRSDATVAVVPIVDRGRTVAALHLERDLPFDDRVLRDVEERARGTILSLENALLEVELAVARDRQASLEAAQARLVPAEYLEALGTADLRVLESGNAVEREWSSLFADLRGFATLSEQLSVDELNELVTQFLRSVEPAIVANDGFVHDTRGDEVFALFRGGADDAVRAGLGMVRAKRTLQQRRAARGAIAVDWGVGINHGPVYLGVVEGVNHRKAGVLGDSLNLASRIEGLTRRYGSDLLVSDRVVGELSDPASFHMRRAERVRVVSKRVPTVVYEIYDADPPELLAAKDATADLLAAGFRAYDELRWNDAIEAFESVLAQLPDDRVAELHLATARRCAVDGTPPEWDGATTLSSK